MKTTCINLAASQTGACNLPDDFHTLCWCVLNLYSSFPLEQITYTSLVGAPLRQLVLHGTSPALHQTTMTTKPSLFLDAELPPVPEFLSTTIPSGPRLTYSLLPPPAAAAGLQQQQRKQPLVPLRQPLRLRRRTTAPLLEPLPVVLSVVSP